MYMYDAAYAAKCSKESAEDTTKHDIPVPSDAAHVVNCTMVEPPRVSTAKLL